MVGWSVSVLGGPSIIYWDHEMIKSIKDLVKIRQSVFTLYSDTSTNRHTDGFLQDCSISSALAMEILLSCVKPWIWYQCICGVVCPLSFRNIFCKTLRIHWSPNGPSMVGPWVARWIHGSQLATVFQQHWIYASIVYVRNGKSGCANKILMCMQNATLDENLSKWKDHGVQFV